MGMTKNLQQFGTPWHKKAVRQPALLIRNSRTEPLWNTRTIGLAALATVAVIGLVSMSGISSPTRRRMVTEGAADELLKEAPVAVAESPKEEAYGLPDFYQAPKKQLTKRSEDPDAVCAGCKTRDSLCGSKYKLFEVQG